MRPDVRYAPVLDRPRSGRLAEYPPKFSLTVYQKRLKMSSRVSKELSEYFREMGRAGGKIGGKVAASNMTKKERKVRALKAVAAREAKREREKR